MGKGWIKPSYKRGVFKRKKSNTSAGYFGGKTSTPRADFSDFDSKKVGFNALSQILAFLHKGDK